MAKSKTSIYLQPELLKALQHRAIDEDVADTVIMERAVESYLAAPPVKANVSDRTEEPLPPVEQKHTDARLKVLLDDIELFTQAYRVATEDPTLAKRLGQAKSLIREIVSNAASARGRKRLADSRPETSAQPRETGQHSGGNSEQSAGGNRR